MSAFFQFYQKISHVFFCVADPATLKKATAIMNLIHLQIFLNPLYETNVFVEQNNSQRIKLFTQ